MDSYKLLSDISKMMVGSKMPFTNQGEKEMTTGQTLIYLIVFILLIILINYIGAALFNMSVVKIMPSIKTIDTLHFFVLNIVLHMLFC